MSNEALDTVEAIRLFASKLVENGEEEPDTGSYGEDTELLLQWQIGTDLLAIIDGEDAHEHWINRPPVEPTDFQLARLAAKLDVQREVEIAEAAALLPPTPQVTFDMLLLVGREHREVTMAEVVSWTDEQRTEVCNWAGSLHLSASDHDDVVIPPMPEVLKP